MTTHPDEPHHEIVCDICDGPLYSPAAGYVITVETGAVNLAVGSSTEAITVARSTCSNEQRVLSCSLICSLLYIRRHFQHHPGSRPISNKENTL